LVFEDHLQELRIGGALLRLAARFLTCADTLFMRKALPRAPCLCSLQLEALSLDDALLVFAGLQIWYSDASSLLQVLRLRISLDWVTFWLKHILKLQHEAEKVELQQTEPSLIQF
jgi:hypothetical protein